MGSVNFTTEQKSLILGTLLGDGCLEKRHANPRLRIDHAVAQKDYVFWKYGILRNCATQEPHPLYDRDNRTGKVFCRWYFATGGMPELNFDKNFGLRSAIHRKGNAWNIYIPAPEMKKARAILDPYIISSMRYKLPPRNDLARDSVAAG